MTIDNFYNGTLKPLNCKVISGSLFNTSIQTLATNRRESRIAKVPYPLFRGRLTDVSLNRDQLDYFNSFFISRGGSYEAFRWNDPVDNKATFFKNGLLDVDPDTYTIGGCMEADGLNVLEFFPAKIYRSRNYTVKRPLHLPIGPVDIYSNGVYVNSVLPDSNGYLSFNGSTTGLSINVKFDIPVRFGINEIPNVIKVITDGDLEEVLYKMADIPLIEQVVPVGQRVFNVGSG
jgi:uncharacterized protein (TIGR02217 family)